MSDTKDRYERRDLSTGIFSCENFRTAKISAQRKKKNLKNMRKSSIYRNDAKKNKNKKTAHKNNKTKSTYQHTKIAKNELTLKK